MKLKENFNKKQSARDTEKENGAFQNREPIIFCFLVMMA